MEDTKRIVEIDGVKVEVDLRQAKRVDTFIAPSAAVLFSPYAWG